MSKAGYTAMTTLTCLLFLCAAAGPGARAPAEPGAEEYRVSLKTIPIHVYKENTGADGHGPMESVIVNVLVNEEHARPLEPVLARIEMYAGRERVQVIELPASYLKAIRGTTYKSRSATPEFSAKYYAPIEESFDLKHTFSVPASLGVDRLVYALDLGIPAGKVMHRPLEVPLSAYTQKTRLIFPLKGQFIVLNGHASEGGHTERSQQFAYDIAGLGPHLELIKSDGRSNEDFLGWGREIFAPAAGVVLYARNDVPDNPGPESIDREALMKLPDPLLAAGGNDVVIDHGNGEYSFLAHMQKGSVRVKTGARVAQGDVLGLLGNSGNSSAPHLHYHLMNGTAPFRSDGLPSHFENLETPTPRQGTYLEAK